MWPFWFWAGGRVLGCITVISLNETGASHLHASGSALPQHHAHTITTDDYTTVANFNVTVGVVLRVPAGKVSTQAGCASACTAAVWGCTQWSWNQHSVELACFLSNGTNWAGVRAANVTSGCLPWVDGCGNPPSPRRSRSRRPQPMPGDKGVVNPKDGNAVLIDDDGVGYIAYTAMAPWGKQPPPGGLHPPGFKGDHMVAIEKLTPDLRHSTKVLCVGFDLLWGGIRVF